MVRVRGHLHDEGGVLVALLVERVELGDGVVEGLVRVRGRVRVRGGRGWGVEPLLPPLTLTLTLTHPKAVG